MADNADTMANAQKVDIPENATGADLASFHNEGQREVDFQEAMMGTSIQDGGRHDLEPKGFSTATYEEAEKQIFEANEYHQQNYPSPMDEQTFVQTPPVGEQDWKKMYGDGENEKGELRRQLAASQQAAQALQEQLATQFQTPVQTPQFFNQPTEVAHQQPVPQQMYQQVPPQLPIDPRTPLLRKDNDDSVLVGDLDEVIRQRVAPMIVGALEVAQQAQMDANEARAQTFNMEKQRMGITPQVEQAILRKAPWVQNIQDPQAYLNTVASLKATHESQVLLQRLQPAQQGVSNNLTASQAQAQKAVQQASRRMVYTEPAVNQVHEGGRNTQEQDWQSRWADTLQLPLGDPRRADGQLKLLRERGISEVTGYRDPSVSTR